MTEAVRFEVDEDGVALITIDLPGESMNVINAQVMEEFPAIVDKVLADDAIKGAVVTTGKKDFMAGADLRMLGEAAAQKDALGPKGLFERNVRMNEFLRKVETGGQPAKALLKGESHAKPFVAAVKGRALGGGFEIPLACHFRVCTPDAVFGLPEVMVGLLPGGGGTQRLPRIMGIQSALMYLTQGRNIKAQEAKGFGIVADVVDEADLIAKAKELVLANPKAVAPWDKKGFKVPGGAGPMNPAAVQTFIGANAMARGHSRGNYPAIKAILSCVYEGTNLPMDTAVRVESKYFTKLLLDPVAGNMIRTLFINKHAAEKGAARPKDVEPSSIKKVGMLGGGLMGGGIVYESAKAGLEVVLIDISQESADKGKEYSERLLKKAVGRGKMTQDAADEFLSRITPTTDYAALKGADLIIEAVFESQEIKREVTTKAEAVVGADTIFGSNTSTLPITGLQQNWSKPENFIGIHFFSPVEKMPLVEMIMGKDTGDKALAVALDYTRMIKKTPIVVNDSRGFYTSRCVGAYIQAGHSLLFKGTSPALIENSGKDAGFPMGPLLLNDSVAIDLSVKIGKQTMADLGQTFDDLPDFARVPYIMSEDNGRHGMKNAKGFYDYAEGATKPSHLWPGLADLFAVADDQPTGAEVQKRLLYRQVVECARCFDEGVLTSPVDGDLGAIFGWGFPPFTGGPFSFMDTVGIARFVEECDSLAQKFGEGFKVPDILRTMAAEGRSFYGDLDARKAA